MTALCALLSLLLLWYSVRHDAFSLRAACWISGGAYALYAILSGYAPAYEESYRLDMVIDGLWFAGMVWAAPPLAATVAAWANLMLGVSLLLLVNHWLLYGYYGVFWIAIHGVLVLSLTVLPDKYPNIFNGGGKAKKSHSFLAFFPVRFVFLHERFKALD